MTVIHCYSAYFSAPNTFLMKSNVRLIMMYIMMHYKYIHHFDHKLRNNNDPLLHRLPFGTGHFSNENNIRLVSTQ